MTLRQYEDQTALLNDPEYIGNLSIEEIQQIQFDRERFTKSREEKRARLLGQGLTEEDIDQLEDAERQVQIDPNGQTMKERSLQEMPRDVAGMYEGGKQALEGVADLAMDISYAIGTDDEYSKAAWKQGVRDRRLEARIEHVETFGQLPGTGWEVAGQTIPWLASSTGQAAKYTYFLAKNAFLGAVGASSQFQPEQLELGDRWLDAAFGATFGTVIAGALGAPAFLKKKGSESIVRAFNSADAQQRELVEGLIQEITKDETFKFSAAQLTGSRFYSNLEIGAADRATKEAQNRNLDILVNNLYSMADKMSRGGMSPGRIAANIRRQLKDTRSAIYAQATGNWHRNASAIMETYGDEVVFNGSAFLQKIDNLVEEQTNALTNVGAKPSKALQDYREHVDQIVNPHRVKHDAAGEGKTYIVDIRDGSEYRILGPTPEERLRIATARAGEANELSGPNAKQTLDIFWGLNRLIGGETAIFDNAAIGSNRQIGRALMGAATGELESNPGNRALAQHLQSLRAGYRADMAAAQALDDSVFASIFGGKKLPKSPGKALDRILKQEPEDIVQFRQFLEESGNTQLLNDVRRAALRRVALKSGARPGAAHVDGAVDLNKLANNLSDGFGREGMFASGLWTPAQQADLVATAEALRVLANKQYKGIVPGGVKVEEFTINMISRSPEFAGRFITRLFASGQNLEQALLDPYWRGALRTIAQKDIDSTAGRAAILYLTQWYAENEEDRKFQNAQREHMAAAREYAEDPARGGTVQ